MTADRSDVPPEAPLSGLERAYVEEFLRMRGYDPDALDLVPQALRAKLLEQASLYASSRLSEMESRAHYVHEIHEIRQVVKK